MERIRSFFTQAPGAAAAIVLSAALALGTVTQYFIDCREVRGDVLRLHVIAASDSETDQTVKLLVRDAVLAEGAAVFDGSVTADEAQQRLAPFLSRLEKAADRVLRENGLPYSASAQLVCEYFDTRSYDGVTLPAGRYQALKIVLGEGKGQNWWCVMFPPLCLPAAGAEEDDAYAVFGGDEAHVVRGEPEYEIRFRIVEIVEKAVEAVKSRLAERAEKNQSEVGSQESGVGSH